MDVAYVSGLSALGGSIIGGLISGTATWMSARANARAGARVGDLVRRQDLFRDFMTAASRSYGNALTNSEPQIAEIVELYALTSRMRVLCSPNVVACADGVMRLIIETYFGPNTTLRELHQLITNGAAIDPLKEFSSAAREELHALAL